MVTTPLYLRNISGASIDGGVLQRSLSEEAGSSSSTTQSITGPGKSFNIQNEYALSHAPGTWTVTAWLQKTIGSLTKVTCKVMIYNSEDVLQFTIIEEQTDGITSLPEHTFTVEAGKIDLWAGRTVRCRRCISRAI